MFLCLVLFFMIGNVVSKNHTTSLNIEVGVITATENPIYFDRWSSQTWHQLFPNIHSYTFEKEKPNITNMPLLWPEEPHGKPSNVHLATFQHMFERNPSAEWYLQVDDDTIIIRNNLIKVLKDYNGFENDYYFGKAAMNTHTTTYIPPELKKKELYRFPFRIGGAGIIISHKLMSRLYPFLSYCRKFSSNRFFEAVTFGDSRVGFCLKHLVKFDTSIYYNQYPYAAFTSGETFAGKNFNKLLRNAPLISFEAKTNTKLWSDMYKHSSNITLGEFLHHISKLNIKL